MRNSKGQFIKGHEKIFFKHSEDTKKRISKSHIGIRPSKKTLLNMSKIKKGNKNLLGFKFSKESKEKMRKSHLGKIPWNKGITGERNGMWKGGISKDFAYQSRLRRVRKANAEGTHSPQEWKELKKKFDFMCLCYKRQEPEIKLTEDHIIPLFKGGSDYIENIQPLCRNCNSRKRITIINYIEIFYDTK